MHTTALTTITVRPWLDTVEDLQGKAFASDTPSQRQHLLLDGKRLTDDGRALALRGVVAECTIQLVCVCACVSKDLLSAIQQGPLLSGQVAAVCLLVGTHVRALETHM